MKAAEELNLKDVGFQTPESVLYDAQADVYLVSNINGNPGMVDNNGYISRVSPDGKVLALKWIDGAASGVNMSGPAGMGIAGDTLYVADINTVRMFDRTTGKVKGTPILVSGATFLNDVATSKDGIVYVTDTGVKFGADGMASSTGSEAVYMIDKANKLTQIAKGGSLLGSPNGITVGSSGRPLVVGLDPTGEVYELAADGKRTTTRKLPAGQLDGLEILANGNLLVSSWQAQGVYQVTPDGKATLIVQNIASPADFGVDTKRNRIMLPVLQENRVVFASIPATTAAGQGGGGQGGGTMPSTGFGDVSQQGLNISLIALLGLVSAGLVSAGALRLKRK